MVKTTAVACVSLFVLLAACKKDEPAKPATPAVPAPAGRPISPPFPPHTLGPSPAEMKDLLTEDKLSRFATYQKEMLPATGDAVGAGVAAYQKGGTDQKKFQGAMANDDRTARVAATAEAALKKSGLTQDEVSKLSRVVSAYYARTYALQDAVKKGGEVRAKIEAAKAKGKEPGPVDVAMDKAYSEQLTRIESVRNNFAARYGQDALALVKKHEPEFFTINEKMVGAAMGGMMHKK